MASWLDDQCCLGFVPGSTLSAGTIGHFSKGCPERLQKKPVSQAKVLVTREDPSARRQTKTLDELLLEIEQLSQERASQVSDEPDDEEETRLLLHEPGKAIIDTGCVRCVIGALTLEAHRSVMGDKAAEIVRHYDTPSVVLRQRDQGSKHWCH